MGSINFGLVGIRIRIRRRQLKISQIQLAESTGFSVPYISLVEHGHKNPSLYALMKISKALDLSIDYLLGMYPSAPDYSRPGQNQSSDCPGSDQKLLLDFLRLTKELLDEYGYKASE